MRDEEQHSNERNTICPAYAHPILGEVREHTYANQCPLGATSDALNGLTDRYPPDTVRDADGGDLEGLELETPNLIIHRGLFGVEGLGDQPHIIDPCVLVDKSSVDSIESLNLHIKPTPLTRTGQCPLW